MKSEEASFSGLAGFFLFSGKDKKKFEIANIKSSTGIFRSKKKLGKSEEAVVAQARWRE